MNKGKQNHFCGVPARTPMAPNRWPKMYSPMEAFSDFLVAFLDSLHPAFFLGLLHPVTDEHDATLHNQKRCCLANHSDPGGS
jgi:hypothetical protein